MTPFGDVVTVILVANSYVELHYANTDDIGVSLHMASDD